MQTVKQFFESIGQSDQAAGIYEMCEWLPLPEKIAGADLIRPETMKFRQMIELRRGRREEHIDEEISELIGRVIAGQDVSGWPALEWLPYMLAVMKFVENSLKNEKKNLNYKPTADEKKAGIDRLNVFEEWGTIDALVREYPQYNHNQIAELQYTEVYMMQWRGLMLRKFERNLIKIQSKTK